MGVVIALFFVAAARYIFGHPQDPGFFTRPFYDPQTWNTKLVLGGTSLAVLTYIGFDGISTLSEEAENPRRNILLATVLTCVVIGLLSALEVYAAQLVWPASEAFPNVDTAFTFVAGRAWQPLFAIVGFTLVVANFGSGMGAQLGAARLLYGMGRSNALPKKFFGAVDPKRRVPRNNVIFVGVVGFGRRIPPARNRRGRDRLRTGREPAELRRADRFHGRQRGRVRALLRPRRQEETVQLSSTGAGLFHLPVPVVEPEHQGADRRRDLDGHRHRLRRLEDARLPRRTGELRAASGRMIYFASELLNLP